MMTRRLLALVAALGFVAACNNHPIQPVDAVLNAERVEDYDNLGTNKVDVLFVVGNSTSMDEERVLLREAFPEFIQGIIELGADFRVGVITPDMETVIERGALKERPDLSTDPGEDPLYTAVSCIGDQDCVNGAGGTPDSVCDEDDLCRVSEGGALQRDTSTQLACSENLDCRGDDGDERAECMDGFCFVPRLFCQARPAELDYCERQAFLSREDYELPNGTLDDQAIEADFRCISAIGTCSIAASRVPERGFDTVTRALDPSLNLNPDFLRDDALLLLVFVTDDDDCSVGPDEASRTSGEACWAEGADPLREVAAFYDYVTTQVKSSPSQVLAASIVGPVPRDFVWDGFQVSCSAPDDTTGNRIAFPGDRYTRFTRLFGARGVVGSICEANFEPILRQITRAVSRNIGLNCISDVPRTCTSDRECGGDEQCVVAAPPRAIVVDTDTEGNETNRTCTTDADCIDGETTENRVCDTEVGLCYEPNLPAGTSPRSFCQSFEVTIQVQNPGEEDATTLTPPGPVDSLIYTPARDYEVDYYAFEQCPQTGVGFRLLTDPAPDADVRVSYPISVRAQGR